MNFIDFDHVQVAMPPGEEEKARAFYGKILELPEVPKPPTLAARGGVWFAVGPRQLHLGVEPDFQPAKKAHPAFRVRDIERLLKRCRQANVPIAEDELLPGYRRAYLNDPFGNRLEILQLIQHLPGANK